MAALAMSSSSSDLFDVISNKQSIFFQLDTLAVITGLPVLPSHKFGFRSSVSKNDLPGDGRHEGLVPRNYVFTNGSI